MRPRTLVLVTGTGTGVGKTWVAAALARELRSRALTVQARKPVQSFEPGEEPTDAEVLAAATGEEAVAVCPPHRWYPVPMAPPIAADLLGRRSPTIAALVDETTWPDEVDVGLVESVGGVRSPLAEDGDTVALLGLLRPDVVVLAAEPGLGSINQVRCAVGELGGDGLHNPDVVVWFGRYDPADEVHRQNLGWLTARDGLEVHVDVAELASRTTVRAGTGSG